MSDFEYLSHTEQRILLILKRKWRWPEGGNSWKSFEQLAEDINRPLKETKQATWNLADEGFVEHTPMVDHDMRPNGSGYFLTYKGRHL